MSLFGTVLYRSGMNKLIIYSHDESIFHSNEDQCRYWGDDTISGLCKKSEGSGLMISDFKSEIGNGSLRFSPEQYQSYLENRRNPDFDGLTHYDPPRVIPFGPLSVPLPIDARVTFLYRKGREGYWSNDLFLSLRESR